MTGAREEAGRRCMVGATPCREVVEARTDFPNNFGLGGYRTEGPLGKEGTTSGRRPLSYLELRHSILKSEELRI